MKTPRFFLVILCITTATVAFSQSLLTLQPISLPQQQVIPGAVLERGIINPTQQPLEFFQLANDLGYEYRYFNDSTRLASITPSFTGDSVQLMKQLLDNDTRLYKSTKFRNTHLVYDPWDAGDLDDALSLQLSPVAGDRLPSQQCFQYAVKSGYNAGRIVGDISGMSTVSFQGHTVLSAKIKGKPTLRDNDPGTFGCVQPSPGSLTGLLSVADAVADHSKITDQYTYNLNGVDTFLCPWQSLQDYRAYFTPNYQEWQLSPVPIYQAKGTNILCGGCTFKVYDYTFENLMINMADSVIQSMMADPQIMAWYQAAQSGSEEAKDSIVAVLATVIPIPLDTLKQYLNDGRIKTVNANTWAPHFNNANYYNAFRFYEVTIPENHQDTILLGKDLSFSYFVHRIEAFGGPIVLKDSVIFTSAEYDLYAPLSVPGTYYSNKVVTLLDKGFIPPGVGARFKLYYNHLMDQNEILATRFDTFGDTSLRVYEKVTYPEWVTDTITVGVQTATVTVDVFKFKVYPNPSDGNITVEAVLDNSITKDHTLVVQNILGEYVLVQKILEGVTQVTLPKQSGVYFISLGGTTKKIVIQ